MMKNFTKILLGLIALATSFSANAEMEWREVVKTDFGGNDESLDPICNSAPSDVDTDLKWIGRKSRMGQGNYMIIKATQLADVGSDFATPRPDINLTNWGSVQNGQPNWAKGGDHTNPSDPNLGYYMVFDCPQKSAVKLYRKALPVSCAGVEFKLEAYFAALDKNEAANTVSVSIIGGGKVLDSQTVNLTAPTSGVLTWEHLAATFKVPEDANYNSVDFLVEALNCLPSGWDIAMDDITISVNQPKIGIETGKFFYKEPATFKTTYDQAEFDAFFGSSYSDVEYRWFKLNETSGDFEQISKNTYSAGKDISYTIPAFEKDLHNGTYRVIVSTVGNSGNNLCSIQKDVVINQKKDEVYVEICKDSSITLYGYVLDTKTYDDQVIDEGSIVFNIKCIKYTPLDPVYIPQCLNNDHPTAGDFRLPDVIEKDPVSGCPITVQKQYLRVKAGTVEDNPAHLCKGETYITDDNVPYIYTEVDEKGLTHIEFDEGGCPHSQYVFVHPHKETTEEVIVCMGDAFQGISYNKKGTYKGNPIKLQTLWGCDSIIIPNITVAEPVEVTQSISVCPSDGYVFNGKVWDFPVDTMLSSKDVGSNGCDSTTTLHLVVNDGGVVRMDTLICREQILFGKEYTKKGVYSDTIHSYTASNCPMDTIWKIQVVEISLKLRMWGNQDQVCVGQPSIFETKLEAFEPSGKKLSPTYHWEPEVPQNVLSPTLYLNESSTYTIFADLDLPSDVDGDAKGCHATASVHITVNPMPELSIDSLNPDERKVEYTVTGGTMPYHIYLGDKDLGLMDSNYGEQDHLTYGKHTLQVQDSTGCSAEQVIVIEATEPEPEDHACPLCPIPHPWRIKNIDVYPEADIRIFDRYGKVLYTGKGGEFEGWDGNYNGNPLPSTDYWYEINVDELDKRYIGHFTLLR